MYLEIQKRKNSHVGFIRTSYRQNGKVKHKQHGSIQGKTLAELKIIQAILRGQPLTADKVEILQSKEYGASAAVLKLAKTLQLDKTIYSRTSEQWVQDALAMIAGRLIYAGSKLGLTRRTKDSALWELSGLDDSVLVVEHCYEVMDRLLERQPAIQKTLAKKHLAEGAFRMLKTVQLEIRPVYHRTDDRIRAHVFICMLAYYLEWHMKQRLGELFKHDGKGAKRRWTFELVIERLKSIRRETVKQGDCSYKVITTPDDEQKRILQLLNIEM